MKLVRYCVMNFRSVKNSGWIDCDDVTTLVGVNESGKSNLLLALWKLNPARGGEIDILHDMPVSELSTLRNRKNEVKFISAEFEMEKDCAEVISKNTGYKCEEGMRVIVSRFYDGRYEIDFPDGDPEVMICAEKETEQEIEEIESKEELENEENNQELMDLILEKIPKFVYYSNYGNLSSKIYLPNVIKWLNGQQIQGIEINEEQVRTLKVLFEFVNLNPEEILELGQDPKMTAIKRNNSISSNPTLKEIEKAENDKEERSILLQSASRNLTTKFADWWKQGEYRFRFEADGDYFRIWVSDEVRKDEVGLELRSTGLQWFLSFYLIFLVESQENHKDAILLLDEAGLTLHPLAQKDLAQFFVGLSENNQIINTTHSPFIIDTSNIDRCRVVYVDKGGFTVCSSDLRQGADTLNEKSIYAVHAAMGLSVSDILLQGCQPIIVEGPSDQIYFNAIKNILIQKKLIAPKYELVFIPSGGVRGVPGIVSILCGKTEKLPFVILDSDKSGNDAKKKLQSGLYKECPDRILEIKKYKDIENAEVEDLIPFRLIERGINRIFHNLEDMYFEDEYEEKSAIVPQIEEFASKNNVALEKGWKVEVARNMKHMLKNKNIMQEIKDEDMEIWKKIFIDFDK